MTETAILGSNLKYDILQILLVESWFDVHAKIQYLGSIKKISSHKSGIYSTIQCNWHSPFPEHLDRNIRTTIREHIQIQKDF